ncbi:hypothetical protein [Arthrobacter silvisoli]|uniref:hypothetical protein n=1 Tax=Arthrobacter silvisoli TaxID=2291022 RepID=UPI00109B94E5|nr:hypothetical protein [Arthrobacter silvisoli]
MSRRRSCGALVLFFGIALAGCSGFVQPRGTSTNPQTFSPARVTVEPDIFDKQGEKWDESLGEGWEMSPAFLVVSDDQDKAAAALFAAARRIFTVDQNGNELTPAEMTGEYPQYTPNYVSDVYLTDLGPMIWTDTKGDVTKAMAEEMLHILVAELRSQEIAARIIAPPADLVLDDERVWKPSGQNLASKTVSEKPAPRIGFSP